RHARRPRPPRDARSPDPLSRRPHGTRSDPWGVICRGAALQGRPDVDRCGDHGAGGARHRCVYRRSRERHYSRSLLRGGSHAARMDAAARSPVDLVDGTQQRDTGSAGRGTSSNSRGPLRTVTAPSPHPSKVWTLSSGGPMQYVLLIYQGRAPLPTDPDAWATLSEEEQKAIYKDYGALNKTQGVSPGLTLGLPEDATTVQVKDGKPSHGRGRTSAKAQASTSCSRP